MPPWARPASRGAGWAMPTEAKRMDGLHEIAPRFDGMLIDQFGAENVMPIGLGTARLPP